MSEQTNVVGNFRSAAATLYAKGDLSKPIFIGEVELAGSNPVSFIRNILTTAKGIDYAGMICVTVELNTTDAKASHNLLCGEASAAGASALRVANSNRNKGEFIYLPEHFDRALKTIAGEAPPPVDFRYDKRNLIVMRTKATEVFGTVITDTMKTALPVYEWLKANEVGVDAIGMSNLKLSSPWLNVRGQEEVAAFMEVSKADAEAVDAELNKKFHIENPPYHIDGRYFITGEQEDGEVSIEYEDMKGTTALMSHSLITAMFTFATRLDSIDGTQKPNKVVFNIDGRNSGETLAGMAQLLGADAFIAGERLDGTPFLSIVFCEDGLANLIKFAKSCHVDEVEAWETKHLEDMQEGGGDHFPATAYCALISSPDANIKIGHSFGRNVQSLCEGISMVTLGANGNLEHLGVSCGTSNLLEVKVIDTPKGVEFSDFHSQSSIEAIADYMTDHMLHHKGTVQRMMSKFKDGAKKPH